MNNHDRKKGNTYCSVPNCRNYGRNGLSFHIFPKDKNLRKCWETILKLDKPASNFMRVCSEHFTETDFFPGSARIRHHLKPYVLPSRKLPGQSQESRKVPVVRPLRVYPSAQYTRKKKDIPVSVNSDGSTCCPKQEDSNSWTVKKEKLEIEINIDSINTVPLEFENSSKLDKEYLADEIYPTCKQPDKTLICNRILADETCNTEGQTYVGRDSNVIVKIEPVFEEEEGYPCKIEPKTELELPCKKEPPEIVLSYKREPSPELTLP